MDRFSSFLAFVLALCLVPAPRTFAQTQPVAETARPYTITPTTTVSPLLLDMQAEEACYNCSRSMTSTPGQGCALAISALALLAAAIVQAGGVGAVSASTQKLIKAIEAMDTLCKAKIVAGTGAGVLTLETAISFVCGFVQGAADVNVAKWCKIKPSDLLKMGSTKLGEMLGDLAQAVAQDCVEGVEMVYDTGVCICNAYQSTVDLPKPKPGDSPGVAQGKECSQEWTWNPFDDPVGNCYGCCIDAYTLGTINLDSVPHCKAACNAILK